MTPENAIKLFESQIIRTHWDPDQEKWFFSIVDVVGALSGSVDPSAYWRKLKQRLTAEGLEPVTNCHRLKMRAEDGKMRITDVADTEQLLRIIQTIPSPKAEPFKQWLAKVGSERLDEIADPERAFERGVATFKQKGYSDNWINQRVKSIQIRKGLTDEWDRSVKEYKQLKGLKKENLRDNMSDIELIFNMLAEASTKEISESENPKGLLESKNVARRGGTVAGDARRALEKQTKRNVITSDNAKDAKLLDSGFAESDSN